MENQIPDVVIQRLPMYARALARLAQQKVYVVSSFYLGEQLGITPAQIRKDLSYFGRFGRQGTGYNIEYLLGRLRQILGLDREWGMALVGMGQLGHAIVRYPGFTNQGFRIVAIFDHDPRKIGKEVAGLTTMDVTELSSIVKEKGIKIGIVAVPSAQAQGVVDTLVRCGIKAILCYAPASVQVPDGVKVRSIDPLLALQSMTFYLRDDT